MLITVTYHVIQVLRTVTESVARFFFFGGGGGGGEGYIKYVS